MNERFDRDPILLVFPKADLIRTTIELRLLIFIPEWFYLSVRQLRTFFGASHTKDQKLEIYPKARYSTSEILLHAMPT